MIFTAAALAMTPIQQEPVRSGVVEGLAVTSYRYDRDRVARVGPSQPCTERVRTPDGTFPLAPSARALLPSGVELAVDPDVPQCLFRRAPDADRYDAVPLRVDQLILDGLPYDEGAFLDDHRRFTAVTDWQSLVLEPDEDGGGRLVVIGSGAVRDLLAPDADVAHRPGTLFAVSVDIDPRGSPIGSSVGWPFWHRVYGGGTDGITLPGEWASTSDPMLWLGDQVSGGPDAPVLSLGIVDVGAVGVTADGFARAGSEGATDVLLVAPGRTDRLSWLLADLGGFPVVAGVVDRGCETGSLPVIPVLARTDAPTDQLRRISQADALLVDTDDDGAVALSVSTRGAVDHDALVAAWEQGLAHWHRTSLQPYDDPDRIPVSPFDPTRPTGPRGWQLEATGAVRVGERLVVGLGQPIRGPEGWTAGLLRLDPSALDPEGSPSLPETCGLGLEWRLHDAAEVDGVTVNLPTDDAYRLPAILGLPVPGPSLPDGLAHRDRTLLGRMLDDRLAWGAALAGRYRSVADHRRHTWTPPAYLSHAPVVRIQPQAGGLIAAVRTGTVAEDGYRPLTLACSTSCAPCTGDDGLPDQRPEVRLDRGAVITREGLPARVAVGHRLFDGVHLETYALTDDGHLVQQAFVDEGDLRRCGPAVAWDLQPTWADWRRFDAERLRKHTRLLTASLWESRWLYRYTDLMSPSREAELVVDVQHAIDEQARWPLAAPRLGEAATAIELLDQDRTVLIAFRGEAAEIRHLGLPVPFQFAEVQIVPGATLRDALPPTPLVVAARMPWLHTSSMRDDLANFLHARSDAEVRTWELVDLAYDPRTVAVFAAVRERTVDGDGVSYHRLTLDQPFFSPILEAQRRPRVGEEPVDDGADEPRLVLESGRIGLRVPVGDGWGWAIVPLDAFPAGVQRQREQPCLDPSEPACEVF